VCTDGVPIPVLALAKVEIAGAYTPITSPPRLTRTCAETEFLRSEVELFGPR
jgi:hypothetical protein